MKIGLALAVFVCAAALNACEPATPAAPSAAEKTEIEQRLQQYYRKAADVPPEVSLTVVDLAPASVPGLLTANLQASNGTNTQKVPLLISRDGHYFAQAELMDLTADPYRLNADKINVTGVPMRGNPNAKVTIVEYSDFQCPFCSRAYNTVESEVLKQYGDKVRLVYKNFPLTEIHPWAAGAALASACARRQNAEGFWKLYDFLFQNQQSITPDNLKEKAQAAAKDAGLDVAVFDKCFDEQAALDLVTMDQNEAQSLGVQSTPTFFVNGRKLEGAVPFDNFKTVIDDAIRDAGA